jgi:hypothetical protein
MKTSKSSQPAQVGSTAMLGAWGRADLMALAAVRYCLGRQSYIVSDCCDWLPTVWQALQPGMRETIARDIEEAFARDDEARERGDQYMPLGMDMDRAQWAAVRRLWEAPNSLVT